MVQGATYLIPVNIDVNLNYVDSIIFTLKCGETKVQKEYPSQTNILKNGKIGIPLNQYETTVLQGLVKIEAQINYKQGRVAKTDIDLFPISPTLATKFIDGSESTEPDIDPIQLNISDPVVAVSGVTFIPSVSEDGVISWTNDGDLTNPKPVNIKGKDGKDGTPGAKGATFIPSVSSDGTLSWVNDGGLQNPNPVNIKGKDGTTGAPGTPGKNGVTFTPEVSNDGVLSWTNDGNLKNPESVDIKGKNGENGDDGITYTPSVSDAGVISWENNGNLPNPEPVNIKGEKGTPGDTPYIGENGNWFIGDTDTGTPAGGSGETGGDEVFVMTSGQTLEDAPETAKVAYDPFSFSNIEVNDIDRDENGTPAYAPHYSGVDLKVKFADEISYFNNNPWAWIQERIKAVDYKRLNINDYIPWTSTNNKNMKSCISGIDTYYDFGDTPIPHHIDFISRDLWPETHVMNNVGYNNGIAKSDGTTIEYPWLSSDLYHWLNSLSGYVPGSTDIGGGPVEVDYTTTGMWNKLPAELQSVIVPKRASPPKRYSQSGKLLYDNSGGWADIGKLWIPSEFEIVGSDIWGYNRYGNMFFVQYPIFKNNGNRLKCLGDDGERAQWWTLSAATSNDYDFVYVSSLGNVSHHIANKTNKYVPICFRVTGGT